MKSLEKDVPLPKADIDGFELFAICNDKD